MSSRYSIATGKIPKIPKTKKKGALHPMPNPNFRPGNDLPLYLEGRGEMIPIYPLEIQTATGNRDNMITVNMSFEVTREEYTAISRILLDRPASNLRGNWRTPRQIARDRDYDPLPF